MKLEMKGSVWEVATMILAVLGLILVILNAGLVMRNQSIQVTATGRQQVINQGLQYARIRQALAQELATVGASKNDRDIIDLLTKHGINVTPSAGVAPAASQGK